jgi:signal transduction histidine kinase
MTLTASPTSATLIVVNELSPGDGQRAVTDGRGLRGMKQRIELLGGTIDIGPNRDGWSVHASVPSGAHESDWPTRVHAS